MSTMRDLICIGCPIGCFLQVQLEDGTVKTVTGNTCKRGAIYGEKECTNPTRIVTSSVRVKGGIENVVSVKTEGDISKEMIFRCLDLLKGIEMEAPVKINDVVIANAAGTGVNIVATRDIEVK
jgi:Uncharacterized protein with conserved CXXC pairs